MSKCFIVALSEEINNVDQICGIPVYYTGIGKLNSAIATYELINKGVTEIINIGSCGSQNHKVGELLKVGIVFQDIDVTPIYEFGLTTKNTEDLSIIVDPTSNVSCFSTDYFFDHNQMFKYSNYYLESIQKYSIFDMECFSQAKICFEKKIKYSSYKWVSDDGNFENWLNNCKIGFDIFLKKYLGNHI